MSRPGTLWRASLLLLFDAGAIVAWPGLAARFGRHEAARVLKGARREMARLIPQLPDTGGWRNPHTQFIVAAALFLALYRALKVRDCSVDEIGALILQAVERLVCSRPGAALRWLNPVQRSLAGGRAFAPPGRQYPDDFVYVFVSGDGANFDYGFDYLECGICKFLHKQGADELAPYLCRLDYPYARAMGVRLTRTTTIAEGGAKCDFRYTDIACHNSS
jgi:hypothetical protein